MSRLTEIPLKASNQEMDISLGGVIYHLRIKYNEYSGWMLDVMTQSRTPVLSGIPVIHGIDIFEQYRYMGLNGLLIFYCEKPENESEFDEFGRGNRLYFVAR